MVKTKAGPVLVAINPFKQVPLYGNNYIEAYKNKSIESPHVYAITDMAIKEMIRGFFTFPPIVHFSEFSPLSQTLNIVIYMLDSHMVCYFFLPR